MRVFYARGISTRSPLKVSREFLVILRDASIFRRCHGIIPMSDGIVITRNEMATIRSMYFSFDSCGERKIMVITVFDDDFGLDTLKTCSTGGS